MEWFQALVPGLLATLVTLLLTPGMMAVARRYEAMDVPGGRKRHAKSTPRLGGVAIVAGIVVALGPGLALLPGKAFKSLQPAEIGAFTFAVGIIFFLGLADDVWGLGPFRKLVFQVVAAMMVVAVGWQFTALRLPIEGQFYLGAVAPLLTVLWIVGVTNAINFIDGLDGLAAGIVAIISCSLLVLAMLQHSPETAVLTSCIAGSCLGFLRHNWRPAKIYMGDSGSLTLGFLLATISLRSSPSVKASAAVAILIPILALGLPVLDTLMVMWYRFLRGHRHMNRVARMFHADRAHIHHLLIDNDTQRPGAMMTLYGLAAAFSVMALLVATSGNLWLGMSFLGVEVAAVVLIRKAGLKAEARRLADERLMRLERGSGAAPAPRSMRERATTVAALQDGAAP